MTPEIKVVISGRWLSELTAASEDRHLAIALETNSVKSLTAPEKPYWLISRLDVKLPVNGEGNQGPQVFNSGLDKEMQWTV